MSYFDIFILAVALGIDCTIASFSQGLCFKGQRQINALRLAVPMGLFQGTFPIVGFIGTDYIYNYIKTFGNWIVFSIFLILGLKFILESFQSKEVTKCIGIKNAIALGFATSIDALVSGATLNLTSSPLILSCTIIGTVSFFLSIVGFSFGNIIRILKPQYMEIFGGSILIFLAIKNIL